MADITPPVARPRDPFKSLDPLIAAGDTRHHVLPWSQMVQQGARLASKGLPAEITKLLEHALENRNFTLALTTDYNGVVTIADLVKNIAEVKKSKAALTPRQQDLMNLYFSILAWLPGNLVCGAPLHRGKDPGAGFDTEAFSFLPTDKQNAIKELQKAEGEYKKSLCELAKGSIKVQKEGWKKR